MKRKPKQKLKTKKAVLKRFKVTATGKILHRPAFQSHFNAKQSANARRKKRKLVPVARPERKALKRLLPYI